MSYNAKIQQSKEKVYNHAIATKILDLMDKLRLDENDNSSRRWIWELMQNAKDVAHENFGVSVEINFQVADKSGIIEFRHNGKPFSIDNLTFLIEQVSTKERKPKESSKFKTTGKFGTGFLTTHLLSEVVEVESVIMEPDEPCRKFNLLLDRSGRDINTIIDSVNNSLASLDDIDLQSPFDQYSPADFNTVFRYKLDENGIEVAKKGLRDLYTTLIFTLVFLPEIKSVKITNENIQYELSQGVSQEGESIKIYTIIQNTPEGNFETKIALLTKNDTSIAVEIEKKSGQIFLKEFSPLVPKLFCDFPLIGTERFSFPVLINSPSFNPNEPRNGVYLTDKVDPKIDENKSIMLDAVELYYILLGYASNNHWGNIHLLAKIPTFKDMDWISKEWFENNVLKPIKEKLLITPIVDTEDNQRISIINDDGEPNIRFPSSSKRELRNMIWDLANFWIPSMLPRKVDVDIWYDIIWPGCNRLTLDEITEFIQENGGVTELEESFVDFTNPIDWLNSYYKLLNMDEDILNDVINDQYAVIPNQNGIFKSRSELRVDRTIEEELKNVLSILGVDSRDYLIHKKVNTGQIKYRVKEQDDIINEINKIIVAGSNDKISQACDYLVTLFSDNDNFPRERELIYQFCNIVYPNDVNCKRIINKWSETIWQEVDKKEIKWIVHAISETGTIQALTERLRFDGTSQTLTWLNSFITFLTEHDFDNLLKETILPNQNGNFLIKDDLFLDDGEIDEILKDISAELGYDFRDELLDLNIYLSLSQKNRTKNQAHVAEEIMKLITPKFAEFPRTEETKQTFNKLYRWFSKNRKKAEQLFGDLYLNRHKLYDDVEIAENMEKAAKYDELMVRFNIKDYTSLENILESAASTNNECSNDREEITENTLAQLGIFTSEELENAFRNSIFADHFVHVPDNNIFKFEYVQKIIERAIANVFKHLQSKPEYNLEACEEIAKTIFSITKNNEDIYIIVRPSDYDQIIIYYDSEKDLLDYEKDCELWVDDGLSTPQKITFGKILKITGINRIPLKKIT